MNHKKLFRGAGEIYRYYKLTIHLVDFGNLAGNLFVQAQKLNYQNGLQRSQLKKINQKQFLLLLKNLVLVNLVASGIPKREEYGLVQQ